VHRERLKGVRAARGVEPTAGRQCRAQVTTVRDDAPRQHPGDRPAWRGHRRRRGDRAAARAASRSVPSVWKDAEADAGSARTTSRPPSGRSARRVRTRWRSRRRTLLRTTALPTALDTTKPARAVEACAGSSRSRWTTTVPRPARRPPRTAAAKSVLRRSRCAAASTTTWASGPTSFGSGRQLVAALGATGSEDGATGTGAHAQPETVGLRAPAVVRLVGALAHVRTPSSSDDPWASRGHQGCKTPTLAECGGATARPYAAPLGWSTIPRAARRQIPPRLRCVTGDGDSAYGVNLFVPGLTRGGYRRLMQEPPRC